MPGPGGPRGRANFLTEEEKKNTPKITKELLTRIFAYLGFAQQTKNITNSTCRAWFMV